MADEIFHDITNHWTVMKTIFYLHIYTKRKMGIHTSLVKFTCISFEFFRKKKKRFTCVFYMRMCLFKKKKPHPSFSEGEDNTNNTRYQVIFIVVFFLKKMDKLITASEHFH